MSPPAGAGAQPQRVLVVLHVESHSGPQRSLEPRLEHLRARGSRITTLVPGEGPASRAARSLGTVVGGGPEALVLPHGPIAAAGLPLRLARETRAVERCVESTRADLVVVSSALLPSAIAGARRAGAAVLVYSGELLGGRGARALAAASLARFAGRRAGAVVACSALVAAAWARRGVAATVVRPPIAAPPDRDGLAARGAALRRRLGIDEGTRLVCSLGAITEGRGQDTLVEALALAVRGGGGWSLAIGGTPYSRRRDLRFAARLRRRVVELGLGDRVVLAGALDDPQALFAAADVFVNPARFAEPFGRAACEALACGCPVVSTRVGGTEEALRDGVTALLVSPQAPGELAGAIESLLADRSLARRLAESGRADVERRLSAAVTQPAFDEAVRAALAARPDRR